MTNIPQECPYKVGDTVELIESAKTNHEYYHKQFRITDIYRKNTNSCCKEYSHGVSMIGVSKDHHSYGRMYGSQIHPMCPCRLGLIESHPEDNPFLEAMKRETRAGG